MSAPVFADDGRILRGIALVNIIGKHVKLETHQIVTINPDEAIFAALDDLGGISFTVSFRGKETTIVGPDSTTTLSKDRVKTLLSLPLTKDELLSIIRHDRPTNFQSETTGNTERWRQKKRKSLLVTFDDFKPGPDTIGYPQHITITHKKNRFDLQWVKLERKP